MAVDARFENAEHSVGVSMPWNPNAKRQREPEQEPDGKTITITLPPGLEWIESYVASVIAREQAKQEKETK